MTNPNENPRTQVAIRFEPEGYVPTGPRLMGRQSAGNGFLRAAIDGRNGRPLWAYTPHQRSADIFSQAVHAIDPAAETRWAPATRLDLLEELGTLYLPDPTLAVAARLRLRKSPLAYSVCGITHSIVSDDGIDDIISLPHAPVMPWDGLICTSKAVERVVKTLLDGEVEYLNWRFGHAQKITLPEIRVIPLGVHCSDFIFTEQERAAARSALQIGDDEIVALYVGRLSYNTKAHPHPMYLGLQGAAERTGKKITLIECGWFATPAIEKIFKDGPARDCPSIRVVFTDGRIAENRDQGWSAADIFVSLSDNVQETFGLTPVEAMASGLPAVVTDWNGYKDTVRDGIDGFRISTWMPPRDFGASLAETYEAGVDHYGAYVGLVSQTVSLDLQLLVQRLTDLVSDLELRRKMGEAGRRRARDVFDWSVVYQQYEDLWQELRQVRRSASANDEQRNLIQAAPVAAPGRMDPYRLFGHYPSALIEPSTIVSAAAGASRNFARFATHPMFAWARRVLPTPKLADHLLRMLATEESVTSISQRSGLDVGTLTRAVSVLAKMGLVTLRSGPTSSVPNETPAP